MPRRHRQLDYDFSPAALVERIVRGAVEHDPVRLHGAIVAALDLHGTEVAERDVFTTARAVAARLGTSPGDAVGEAIGAHLHAPRRPGTPGKR